MTEPKTSAPPPISPYLFPLILAGFGLWCLYDGWFSANPEMQKHLLFNRIAAVVLLVWAVADFVRTRKREQAERIEHSQSSGVE
jgi:hypothetical protein